MKNLLELIELIAALAVLLLCFATHKVPRYYRLSQYGVFVAFLSAFVFHVCEVPIPGPWVLGWVALSVGIAAGCVLYFRARSWQLPERLEFLTKTAIWLPALLLSVTALLYYLLANERANKRAEDPVEISNDPAPSVLENRRRWERLKPPAAPVWILLLLFCGGSAFGQAGLGPIWHGVKSCCEQTLDLQAEVKRLEKVAFTNDSLYRACYESGQAVMADLEWEKKNLKVQTDARALQIQTLSDRVATLEAENREWVPKTRFGRFIRRSGRPVLIGAVVQGLVQVIKAVR